MSDMQNYTSSLSERYPSKEMKYLFSPEIGVKVRYVFFLMEIDAHQFMIIFNP